MTSEGINTATAKQLLANVETMVSLHLLILNTNIEVSFI